MNQKKMECLPDEFLNQMAEIIKLLGHAQRLRILEFLDFHGECSVSAIVVFYYPLPGARKDYWVVVGD